MYRSTKRNIFGFSFVEIVFAFMILAVGIIGVLALLVKSINLQKQIPFRIQASLLADEAMVVMRNIKETNILQSVAWDTTLANCQPSPAPGDGCFVGYDIPCFTCGPTAFSCVGAKPQLLVAFEEAFPEEQRRDIKILSGPAINPSNDIEYVQGYYRVAGGCFTDAETQYRRRIDIDYSNFPNFIEPTVTVTWQLDGPLQVYTLTSRLYP